MGNVIHNWTETGDAAQDDAGVLSHDELHRVLLQTGQERIARMFYQRHYDLQCSCDRADDLVVSLSLWQPNMPFNSHSKIFRQYSTESWQLDINWFNVAF